jgi:endonuclease/exonuclease/phosphatase family metal-dependent hydrolase
MLVMSYNVQGHAARRRESHINEIAETINQAAPDIVGLQEVHCGTRKSRGVDQAEELARLTGMNVYFGRSCSLSGGNYGNAVLTRGQILSATEHPLPGAGEPRSVLESEVAVGDDRVAFFVTHLSLAKDRRRRPAGEQVATLRQRTDAATSPPILVGDFNFTPSSALMAMLMETKLKVSGETREVTHRMFRRRIDYIFAGKEFETVRAGVLRVGPSDHWPLFAELTLKELE